MRAALHAIIPAAGWGSRIGGEVPKQYLPIAGVPMLLRSVERLLCLPLTSLVVAVSAEDRHATALLDARPPVTLARCGGPTRAATVRAALDVVHERAGDDDWVLVHDAARPCVPADTLARLVASLADDPVGGLLAMPVADTLKRAEQGSDDVRVARTEDRGALWAAQTPQMFRVGVLARALSAQAAEDATDEAQAVERLGLKPRLVPGSTENLKVTWPGDLALATAIWMAQESRA